MLQQRSSSLQVHVACNRIVSAQNNASTDMFDLTGGEAFVVLFVLISVVSAKLWPAAGELVARRLACRPGRRSNPD